MKQQHILSLDIATNLGWAYAHDGYIKGSGAFNLSKGNDNHEGKRLKRFYHDFLNHFTFIDHIIYEKVAVFGSASQSQNQVKLYYQVLGMVQFFAAESGNKPTTSYQISTWKKEFTGSGRAKKEDVGRVLQYDYGWERASWGIDGKLLNNDEADALALQFVHASRHGYELSFDYKNEKKT